MKKVNLWIPSNKFGTIKSKYQPESNYVSQDEFTSGSYNFITNATGAIEKRPTDVQYNSTTLTLTAKDQFEAIFANGTHHLLFMDGADLDYTSGDTVVHTATTGYTATASMEWVMYQNRVYFDNGIDAPGVYDLTASYGGVSYTPPQVKTMGAQAPTSAITFNADSSGGSVPAGGHIYKTTFLYYGNEESNGGTASALHTVSNPNNTVNLKTIPTGGYGVTTRKIYRDNNDGNFLLVGTISDNTTTTFVDTVSAGTTPIPVSNNTPPVFSYIVLNLSRLWLAGVSGTPTTLYWSNPGLPDIFDPNNFTVCNPKDPIQALAVYQGTTYVLNRHSFGQILGNTDDTFFYQEFPGSVGCVDNRSIQVRTINGVPVLIWLSDRGLYAFNGSSVEYISDPIEDLVNLNLQQVNFVSNSNSQTSQADFQAGTSSPGIDLISNPGTITLIDPEKIFQSESDWEGGSSLSNISTFDGTNTLKVPVLFAPTLASGTYGGSAFGNPVTLPIASDFTGESKLSQFYNQGSKKGVAYPIQPTRTGVLIDFSCDFGGNYGVGGATATIHVWSDSLGRPGTILFTGATQTISGSTTDFLFTNTSINFTLTAGVKYWVGATVNNSCSSFVILNPITPFSSPFLAGGPTVFDGTNWVPATSTGSATGPNIVAYTFSQNAVAGSGTWTSPIYDTFSTSVSTTLNLALVGSYPSGSFTTTGVATVQGSVSPTFASIDVTQNVTNLNGNQNLSISGVRYWRIIYTLSTDDDRHTPLMAAPTLKYSITGTWISPVIDCTTDVTSYNAIIITDNVPAGTSVTVTVATSADNITYTSYGPVGSATVQRYVKVKVVLVAMSDDSITPSVSLLNFNWNLTSTFISSIINTGQTPSGWGVFQDQAAVNGGTLTFYMRSASSSGAISGATFYQVFNGVFPNVLILPLQYTQWKIIFTSAPAQSPTVDSVTVNWFLGNNQSPIRAASLFFNKTYYLAAAEVNQPSNNIVIIYDFEGNWRIFRDININSLSLFYNQPFYCDAVRKNIYQWLIPPTGTGTAITMVVKTKYFGFGEPDHLKNPRSFRVIGLNTGTTIHAYYSVNRGVTWIEMLNTTGTTGFTTSTDGNKFSEYFVPDYTLGNDVSGVNIMYRITSTDAFPCTLIAFGPEVVIRAGRYIGVTND